MKLPEVIIVPLQPEDREQTIERSIDGEKAEAYRIVLDGQKVGGVVLQIDEGAGNWSMDDEMFVFRKEITNARD